jgi:uncharacterized protein (TIGR04255 family)
MYGNADGRRAMASMSEDTQALAGLPAADRTLLEQAPLELAVVEVRFQPTMAEITAESGLRLRGRLAELGHPFVQLDQAQQGQVSINIPVGGQPIPQVQAVASGWRLLSSGGHLQVTLMPGMVAIQTSRYERWSVSLRPVLEAVLEVTGELLSPALVGRIGLRYINRFVDRNATTASAWKDRIHEQLLGPVWHPVLGDLVRGTQQQVELGLGDTQGALLRHGPITDPAAGGATSYLLDIDVYDAEPSAFKLVELIRRAEALNRTAATLFQAALTPAYLHELQHADIEAASSRQVVSS